MNTAPALFVKDLHKHYGTFEAVRGIDLEVMPGEVFGLLGPNGAGKTTQPSKSWKACARAPAVPSTCSVSIRLRKATK